MVLLPSQSYAATNTVLSDPLIEGAKLCTRHLPRYERENGIPTHLLSAIASTESGRYHDVLKMKLPWPWSINAEGKGYFFDSKEEAIRAVKKLRAQGIKSIDVGCMQVNLHQHPDAFSTLDEAFEPESNIAYAARFLHEIYTEENSWKKAAAGYHSRTPSLGRQYVGLVYNSWYEIIDKLRAARLQVPESSIAGMNELKPTGPIRRIASNSVGTRHGESVKTLAAHTTPHIRSIRVSRMETADAGDPVAQNMVITRPATMATDTVPAVLHSATPAPMVMTFAQAQQEPEPASPKIIRLDGSEPAIVPVSTGPVPRAKKSGPNFIFND